MPIDDPGPSADGPRIRPIQPPGFPRPRGYSNGMLSRGPVLHIAGQVGWEPDGTFATDDLAGQFARALDHVLAVVSAAGGQPTDVVDMTIYVTDLDAYRAARPAIGDAWLARLGRHFPAMALVGVTGLVEPRAKVEIQAVAAVASLELEAHEGTVRDTNIGTTIEEPA